MVDYLVDRCEMDLSIVICCFNNLEKLILTLKFLMQQKELEKYAIEIIIIDDHSDVDMKAALDDSCVNQSFFRSIKIYRNELNMGPAASRNRGAELSSAENIIFIDSDIILSSYVLKCHMDALMNNNCEMYISRIFDISSNNYKAVYQRLSTDKVLDEEFMKENLEREMDPFFEMREEVLNSRAISQKCIWVFGTFFCTSIKREVFRNTGGFDNYFYGWGPEDIDLSYRVYKAGYKIQYLKDAICYHLDIEKKDRSRLVKDITRNTKYLSQKYNNKEITDYLRFYKGSISFEEFEACMEHRKWNSEQSQNHKIGILNFIKFKCKESE